MNEALKDDGPLNLLVQWGEKQEQVRAMLLYSSRADPDAPVDAFSDYDVILAVTDIHPFWRDKTWLENFGRVLVVYRNPIAPDDDFGIDTFAHIVQYENGTKMDLTFFPIELMRRVVENPTLLDYLDPGYSILLDKDHLTDGIEPPTYKAYIPTPPSEEVYLDVVEEFFHECTYIAKHLWREDLVAAKTILDGTLKCNHLRRMLEWRIEIDLNWSVKLGAHGKQLKKWLSSEQWAELENTYTGAGYEDNFDALFRTIFLFRKVAIEIGDSLGFVYPHDLDQRMMVYLTKVRNLDRQAETFP